VERRMKGKIFTSTLALVLLSALCSVCWGWGLSTDKDAYSIGETVTITIGIDYYYYGGTLHIKEDGFVRSFDLGGSPGLYNVTLIWDQLGNATDPYYGTFYQVEPGPYEVWWAPYGIHGYFVIGFQISAPVGGHSSQIEAFATEHAAVYYATFALLIAVLIILSKRTHSACTKSKCAHITV
jgi:hypothetical protein